MRHLRRGGAPGAGHLVRAPNAHARVREIVAATHALGRGLHRQSSTSLQTRQPGAQRQAGLARSHPALHEYPKSAAELSQPAVSLAYYARAGQSSALVVVTHRWLTEPNVHPSRLMPACRAMLDGVVVATVSPTLDRSSAMMTGRLMTNAPAIWEVLGDAQHLGGVTAGQPQVEPARRSRAAHRPRAHQHPGQPRPALS